jgi:predicted acetyltransferase
MSVAFALVNLLGHKLEPHFMDHCVVTKIRLEQPHSKYKESFLEAFNELQTIPEKLMWNYLGEKAALDIPQNDFERYVQTIRLTEIQAPPNFVTQTCYWAIYDCRIIGRIAIRHKLNDFLAQVGAILGTSFAHPIDEWESRQKCFDRP